MPFPGTGRGMRNTRPAPTAVLSWAVLAAAVLQAVAPAVTILGPGASPGAGSGADLLITPVGWAFSIWGPIYALAICQAVLTLRGGDGGSRRLQVSQLVLYLGATVWIVMAGVDSSTLTALALAVMFAAAVRAALDVARRPDPPDRTSLLTRTSVGLYAGWVTAAFFLNVATATVALDLAAADSLVWQVVILVAATTSLTLVLVRTRGLLAYAVAGVWALVGIAVTGASDGTATVVTTAVVGVVVLVGTTLGAQRLRTHPH